MRDIGHVLGDTGETERGPRCRDHSYRALQRLDGFTLLQVQPETGRTHQIRVHLSAIGHPVVGDKVYGGTREKKFRVRAERQMLHAWRLGLFDPKTDSWMESEAPPSAGGRSPERDRRGRS